ncbi:MAG TPA: DJ-1 family glyoxalase III [Haliangium sp.]|nr:DJ-1 family glyoxalase III [Haliangium sp.]
MATRGSVLVPLLEGFEEIEAVTIIDVLRRAGVRVIVASDRPGPVRGSHDISVLADAALADVDVDELSMIALPGGMPRAAHLAEHPVVQRLIREARDRDRHTAAVCAAPMALGAAGALAGKTATCYPGFEDRLTGASAVEDRVVVDGKVVTSRGPGTALEFALTLVGILAGDEKETALTRGMLVQRASAARHV